MRKQKIDKTNLGYLGVDYQYKLVKYFIEDTGFFDGIVNIVVSGCGGIGRRTRLKILRW